MNWDWTYKEAEKRGRNRCNKPKQKPESNHTARTCRADGKEAVSTDCAGGLIVIDNIERVFWFSIGCALFYFLS